MATQATKREFGKWRSFLWPVHNFELKKLLPMLLLFFFINFNYTVLRDTKDALVVTAPGSGAEAIPFLKRFTVFNVEQCDGLPETASAAAQPLPERQIIPRAEALIAATRADFRIGGARAYYDVGGDFIQVPPQPAFFVHKDLILRSYRG